MASIPMVRAVWQAGFLSAASNVLAQLVTCWRESKPYSLNVVDIFQFTLFAVLNTPPNVLWQAWLEAQYPGFTDSLPTRKKEALVDKVVAGKTTEDQDLPDPSRQLNIQNTVIKIVLHNTLGGIVNNLLFIAGIGLIRGQTSTRIQQDIHDKFWPTIIAGLKLWPLVSVLNFTVVPLQYRMLAGNIVGLFWGIYLSLVAGTA